METKQKCLKFCVARNLRSCFKTRLFSQPEIFYYERSCKCVTVCATTAALLTQLTSFDATTRVRSSLYFDLRLILVEITNQVVFDCTAIFIINTAVDWRQSLMSFFVVRY